MGSSWSALMFVLLPLLMLVVPLSNAQDTVSFAQVGLTKEPFDVNKSVDYNILVNNNMNYNMLYTVNLEVGFDTNYPDVFKRFADQSVSVNPHSTSYATFNVNFRSPELFKGDLKTWALDKNDTSSWDRAWYRVTITPLAGKGIALENYEGHPRLCKPFFEFRRPMVNPTQGSNKDQYSYEVTALGSYVDNISLQVAPTKNGPWTDLGSRQYSTPNTQQTLMWDNNTLNFDFNIAYYKFVGKKNSTVLDGPFWPVPVQFRNNTLTPLAGTPRSNFQYSIEINASKPIDVSLNVLDIHTGEYSLKGIESYNDSNRWKKLTWDNIIVTSDEDADGRSSYYFGFHYPGSVSSFNSTKNLLCVAYLGPYVGGTEINAEVSPANGSIYTPFTYTAKINSVKPSFDVELEIKPPNSTIWAPQGKQTYDNNDHVLIWPNLSFRTSPEVLGYAKYRFVTGDSVLGGGEFLGPKIDVAIRNEGFKRLPNNNFDYSAEVRSYRPKVDMELMFTDDGVIWKRSGQFRTYQLSNNSSDQPPWITLYWKNQPWHKSIRVDERRR
ncbi:MAG: hypothetical protein ACE14P_13025 [Methanotrichaceae archaeon]